MERPGLRPGHFLAGAGAVALLGSLWAPWYRIEIGGLVRGTLQQGTSLLAPEYRDFAAGAISRLPDSISVDAWHVFSKTDVVLAVVAVLILGLVLVAGGAFYGVQIDRTLRSRAFYLLGFVAAGAVVFRMLAQPGPDEIVSVAYGAWIALAGAAAILVGGWWGELESLEISPLATVPVLDLSVPPEGAPASVPPPGA